MIVGKSGTIF